MFSKFIVNVGFYLQKDYVFSEGVKEALGSQMFLLLMIEGS